MTDEKQIEEMAKEMEECGDVSCEDCKKTHAYNGDYFHCYAIDYAETLYNAGYRKLPENAVVTTREMYDELYKKANLYEYQKENAVVLTKEEHKQWLKDCIESNKVVKEITRKETAREVIAKIIWYAVKHIKGKNKDECFIEISFEKIDEIAKQYGVEIEE